MSHDLEQTERAVLTEIVCLLPAHLTPAELVVRMSGELNGPNSGDVRDSIQALQRSSLVRNTGDVLEPTYAAIRAVELLAL